eukprot:CAMPEP_0195042018 /NCGR_PEP_ID=MMETSP0347-20130606/1794_1 /TAXON_ID=2932 /ORGANISM="Alexandrium fundyense, Strain CCMP1719" /LENGTH=54 /DNA_ID=CAMNT_0040069171 /DNA_START=1 /DNA_END=162 /DNA_ORIENTATION=-
MCAQDHHLCVEMGAKHVRNGLWREACRLEVLQERLRTHVPMLEGALLVVPNTSV